jgi:hypothetical protein
MQESIFRCFWFWSHQTNQLRVSISQPIYNALRFSNQETHFLAAHDGLDGKDFCMT